MIETIINLLEEVYLLGVHNDEICYDDFVEDILDTIDAANGQNQYTDD